MYRNMMRHADGCKLFQQAQKGHSQLEWGQRWTYRLQPDAALTDDDDDEVMYL